MVSKGKIKVTLPKDVFVTTGGIKKRRWWYMLPHILDICGTNKGLQSIIVHIFEWDTSCQKALFLDDRKLRISRNIECLIYVVPIRDYRA